MRRFWITAALAIALAACSPSRDFHGYIPDEARPGEIEPGTDTRSTVLARLGSPSTKSIFDDDTWIYMSETQTRRAFFKPKTAAREVTAIRFGESDLVDEVLQYDADDGDVIRYAARETPTSGRELSLFESIFGNIGASPLPIPGGDQNPGNGTIPGQR